MRQRRKPSRPLATVSFLHPSDLLRSESCLKGEAKSLSSYIARSVVAGVHEEHKHAIYIPRLARLTNSRTFHYTVLFPFLCTGAQ